MVEVYEPVEEEELEVDGRAWSASDEVGDVGTSRSISTLCASSIGGVAGVDCSFFPRSGAIVKMISVRFCGQVI